MKTPWESVKAAVERRAEFFLHEIFGHCRGPARRNRRLVGAHLLRPL
jgi:hypothetical protein